MSKEEKKDSPAPTQQLDVAEIVKQAIAQALPAAVQIAMQSANAPKASAVEEAKAAVSAVETGRCTDCQQPIIRGKYACNKKHRQVCVFPEMSPEYFPGLGLNGHWYRSNGFGHMVTVPADFNVEEMLKKWDVAELEAKIGKKRNASQYQKDFRHNGASF